MSFSNAWKDKEGKNKTGVKFGRLRKKPKHDPKPNKEIDAEKPKEELTFFEKPRRGDK